MLELPFVAATDLVVLLLLTDSPIEEVAPVPDAEVELAATEIDPRTPVVVVDTLPASPLRPVLVALALALAGPSFSAPAVTPTGKYVISAGPRVDVTS